uniref:Uncharacterized protein n=1 Tax=Anopheles farauti TaxID=69004 RepID=A0A182QS72_9DIPT
MRYNQHTGDVMMLTMATNAEETINAENLLQHPNAKEWLIAAAKSDYQLLAKLSTEHPNLVKLQMGQPSRRRTSRARNVILQLARMASGFTDKFSGTEHRLRRQSVGQITRQSHANCTISQCLNHHKHIRWTAAGQGRDGIHHRFRDFLAGAHGLEECLRHLAIVVRSGGPFNVHRSSGSHECRGIGHHSYYTGRRFHSRNVTPIAIDMNSLPALAGRTACKTLETTVGLTEMKTISEPLTTGRFSTYVLAPNDLNASILAWSEG